jgi:hypothetical protein
MIPLKEVLDWNPQGQWKRGRPKETWRRSVHEALGEGKSWGEVKQLARNRIRWRLLLMPYVPKGITGYDDDMFAIRKLVHLVSHRCSKVWFGF